MNRLSCLTAFPVRLLSGLLILVFLGPGACAQVEVLRRVADDVIRETDFDLKALKQGDQPSRYNAWMYQNFMLFEGMDALGRVLSDESYGTYARRNIEFFCEWESKVRGTDLPGNLSQFRGPREMWHCGMVAAFADQQKLHPSPEKRRGMDHFDSFLASATKLADGTLVRNKRAPYDSPGLQIDDLYMVAPYWVRLWKLTDDRHYLDRAAEEALRYHDYLWNESERLLHCLWLERTSKPAAHYWGRGNGWYVMAMTDLLQHLPLDHSKRPELLADFREVMAGIAARQDVTGLWHQLLDRADSFTESSCSGMFTWGFLKGANEGWLDADAADVGARGWDGLQTKVTADYKIQDVCPASGMNENPDYYLDRPRVSHDQHAIGPFLLAGAELLKMQRYHAR